MSQSTPKDGPELHGAALLASSMVLDLSFGNRLSTLLRTEPLHRVTHYAQFTSFNDARYDYASLCLAAIDAVLTRQGFSDEASYDEVADVVRALAASAEPRREPVEHLEVGRFVIDELLNRREREAKFVFDTAEYRSDELTGALAHRLRSEQFRLLSEHEHSQSGRVVLRASNDAINALVGSLQRDVEDEQAAHELVLERQLARGAIDAAEATAEQGRLLSVQYGERVRAILAETTRDVRGVDWDVEIPQMLDRSRDHLAERLGAEERLLDHVRGGRLASQVPATDAAGQRRVMQASGRISSLLEQCRARHTELHTQIIKARSHFLDEHARQRFRRPADLGTPDVGELLTNLLATSAPVTDAAATAFADAVHGCAVPKVLRLEHLINDLLARRREAPALEPESAPDEDVEPERITITEHDVERSQAVLAQVGLPCRLSALLTAAADEPRAAHLLTLSAMYAYGGASSEDSSGTEVLLDQLLGGRAVVDSDGTPLNHPGWDGDNLIIAADDQQFAQACDGQYADRLGLVRLAADDDSDDTECVAESLSTYDVARAGRLTTTHRSSR